MTTHHDTAARDHLAWCQAAVQRILAAQDGTPKRHGEAVEPDRWVEVASDAECEGEARLMVYGRQP